MRTPIQLLGKDDWSVDWYNLEKSTRVKAFRCGEFDEFIERAETSGTDSRKKRNAKGKNVSRNDAVLHALRLEKLCFSDRNKKTSNGSMNSILKAKSNVQAHSERSHELVLIGNPSLMESDTTEDFYIASPLSSSKDSCSLLKHKHSQIVQELGYFGEKVSRRPRTHVFTDRRTRVLAFEYQRALPGLSSCHGISQKRLQTLKVSSKDANFSSVNDDTPSYSGASCEGTLFHMCESKVDSNLECEMDREVPSHNDRSLGFIDASLVTGNTLAQDVSCPIVSRKLQSCIREQHSGQADLSPQLHEVLAEIYSTTSATQVDHGKRNLSLIGNVASESSFVVEMESSAFGVTKGQAVSEAVEDIAVRIHSSNPFSNGIDVFVSPPLLSPTGSSLYDVKLNVNPSYHGPHATLVSLVSKSSGQDVTGFPVPVEVLEDGFVNVENLVDVFPSSKRKHSRGKKSGLSPKKTRKISLITVDAKRRKPVVKKNRGPSISCVPMSVVFSRLNEALRG